MCSNCGLELVCSIEEGELVIRSGAKSDIVGFGIVGYRTWLRKNTRRRKLINVDQ